MKAHLGQHGDIAHTRQFFVAFLFALLMHAGLTATTLLGKRPRPIGLPTIDIALTDTVPLPENEPIVTPPMTTVPPPKDESRTRSEPARKLAPPPAPAAPILTKDIASDREGVVTGDAGAPASGQVGASGRDKGPPGDGPPDAPPTATGASRSAAPPAPPAIDRSRPASLAHRREWQCPWPPEAEEVDEATVAVRVNVDADGVPSSVQILTEPGNGFGREARRCAMRERYSVALDREGRPVAASTATIRIRFQR